MTLWSVYKTDFSKLTRNSGTIHSLIPSPERKKNVHAKEDLCHLIFIDVDECENQEKQQKQAEEVSMLVTEAATVEPTSQQLPLSQPHQAKQKNLIIQKVLILSLHNMLTFLQYHPSLFLRHLYHYPLAKPFIKTLIQIFWIVCSVIQMVICWTLTSYLHSNLRKSQHKITTQKSKKNQFCPTLF